MNPITVKLILIIFYLISIVFVFLSSNIYSFWFTLEIQTIIFLGLLQISINKKIEFRGPGLFYFIIQSLGSMVFLFTFIFENSIFNFSNLDILWLLMICLKRGIIPFHLWVYEISDNIESLILSLLITLHKIPMISFVFFNITDLVYIYFLIFSFIPIYLIFFSHRIKDFSISSSIYINIWFILSMSFNIYVFLIFSLVYFFFFYNFLNLINKFNFILAICVVFIISLPPSAMFFLKVLSIGLFNIFGSFNMLFFFFYVLLRNFGYVFFLVKLYSYNLNNFYNMIQTKLHSVFYFFFIAFSIFFFTLI